MPFQKGNRLGGRRRRTTQSARSPTPVADPDVEDEEMVDGDADAEETRNATPAEDGEEAGTPAQDEDEEGEGDEDEDEEEPVVISIPRRRGRPAGRRGRPPLRRGPTPEGGDDISDSGTPGRRSRGRRSYGPGSRGGRGGFRGRRKGVEPAPKVIDEYGNALEVVGDEAQVDEDDEGDDKVDEFGHLLGGREYRVRTFTILGRGDRLYMLSTEPARCCGFRDSYLFFTKHPKLFKVLLNAPEKEDLIARDILPNSYKGRNIGVVTARSVFREFGARIIVGGKRITDDYKAAEARANGEVEGELADPDDTAPREGEDYNRNRYVAWFGASEVYRQPGGAGGVVQVKQGPSGHGRRRNNMTRENWQLLHAREASRFNSTLSMFRRATMDGVYDTHTNMMHYPTITQPTHVKWEQITPLPAPIEGKQKPLANGDLTNGHTNTDGDLDTSTTFSDVPPVISRNFLVVDTVFSAPPLSNSGFPGPDSFATDQTSGTDGLSSSHVVGCFTSPDILAELPDDCRAAFAHARATEQHWKTQWGSEAQSGMRGDLKVGFSGYPL